MVTQTPHLWNSLPNSAIIQDVSGALPGVDADGPACGDTMTAQPLHTAHLIKRAGKCLRAKFPARRSVFMVRFPKPRKMCKHCGIMTDELCLGVCYDCVEVLS